MTQLVIFDKDGVLFDTETGKTLSYWLALTDATLGIELQLRDGGWDQASYIKWHTQTLTGKGRVEVVQRILDNFPEVEKAIDRQMGPLFEQLSHSGEEVTKELSSNKFLRGEERVLSALRLRCYNAMPISERCIPIAKMISFANALVQNWNPLALITESELSRTKEELKFYGGMFAQGGIFNLIACKDGIIDRSGEKVAQGSAKDEMYRTILRIMKARPEDCLAIEDTDKGREQARKAGIACLQVFFP